MNKEKEVHLTNEQFATLMLGDALDIEVQKHISRCAACETEASKFASSVDLFATSSLGWSDNTTQHGSLAPIYRKQQRQRIFLPMALALATLLLMVGGIPLWQEHKKALTGKVTVAQPSQGDTASQVAEDNRLMQSVNVVLSSNQGSPLPEYRLADSYGPDTRITPRSR